MLDEKSLRTPGFTEGPRVKLGDGQEWTFPRPYLTMHVQCIDGAPVASGRLTFGRDYSDRLDDLIESTDDFEKLCIQLELAAGLLLRNYSLDDRALRRLISIDLDGSGDPEMWLAIRDVLFGRDRPKPSAVGSSSPSEPTASTPTASS